MVRGSELIASITRTTSTGAWRPLTAAREVMGCGELLSSRVKSCCCRSATGGPDFGLTTTSRWMLPPTGWVWGLDCWAETTAVQRKATRSKRPTRELPNMGCKPPGENLPFSPDYSAKLDGDKCHLHR